MRYSIFGFKKTECGYPHSVSIGYAHSVFAFLKPDTFGCVTFLKIPKFSTSYLNCTHLIENLMACREHIWTNSSSDRRSNVSHVNQHIRREVCNICTNNRWVCQVEGCSHVSIPSLKLTTSSNIAQHLSTKHGFFYTEEKPIAKSREHKRA